MYLLAKEHLKNDSLSSQQKKSLMSNVIYTHITRDAIIKVRIYGYKQAKCVFAVSLRVNESREWSNLKRE